jgi:O-acetyl-ADP-ribose deacetylase (regulator of RNase III)/uncharacterized protein YwgA
MITVLIGDLFESDAQTLVNTVNTVGVMGKGVALEFKRRFPEMYADYLARCKRGEVKLGQPYLFASLVNQWVLNFPTKGHWRAVSRLDDIVEGLDYLAAHYREWGIKSLAVPPLGCGNGQLDWSVVGPTLYSRLKRLDIPVALYAPFDTPLEELQPAFLDVTAQAQARSAHRVEPGWIALVAILDKIEQEPYRWPVGRIGFQKLAYFATAAGIPTGLHFVAASFGPFSSELRRVMASLVNNGLIREEELGRMFATRVGGTFKDAYAGHQSSLKAWQGAIERVTDLFLRMNTKQAEVAATVHFAAAALSHVGTTVPTEREVLEEVMRWKQRRRPPLSEPEVAMTIRHLAMLGWIDVTGSSDLPLEEDRLITV